MAAAAFFFLLASLALSRAAPPRQDHKQNFYSASEANKLEIKNCYSELKIVLPRRL